MSSSHNQSQGSSQAAAAASEQNSLEQPCSSSGPSLQQIEVLKSSIAHTMSSINEIEHQIRSQSSHLTEETKRAILTDVSQKLETTKQAINTSLREHKVLVNSSFEELTKRLELLKSAPINADGSLQLGSEMEKEQ